MARRRKTARTGSFALAADELSLTQSAVRKHVMTLEACFSRKLFVRRGPRMIVTAEAHICASDLRRGFRQIEEACVRRHRYACTTVSRSALTVSMPCQ
ncbi:LysR family transcriptional regulator [Burkholderia cepacia]|uniref:LysR family transcriptional regulator n=1 Tax=Burkholderia cepacia TaxID=292 RepID=UPI00398F153D